MSFTSNCLSLSLELALSEWASGVLGEVGENAEGWERMVCAGMSRGRVAGLRTSESMSGREGGRSGGGEEREGEGRTAGMGGSGSSLRGSSSSGALLGGDFFFLEGCWPMGRGDCGRDRVSREVSAESNVGASVVTVAA